MRVVLTHPYCWPYVRRGSERNIDVLSRYLIYKGYEVTTISTRPGVGTAVETTDAGRRILHAPLVFPLMSRMRIQTYHTFFFRCLHSLASVEADVVHSFFYSDSLAAHIVNRKRKYKTILQLNGLAVPGVSCYRWLPPEGWMLSQAITRSDHRITCSNFIRQVMLEHYQMDSHVIPPPVDVDSWSLGAGPPDGIPTILSVADFDVRRKGIRVLVKAFKMVREMVPAAVLKLSGRISPRVAEEAFNGLPEFARSGIEVLGLGRIEDLPSLYGTSSVMVLPSMWEPSGTVMMEAWASGTPVVATNHAGLPEFMSQDVGVLFDPLTNGEETMNIEGLAEAIMKGLALSQEQGIRERCRAHAERFSCSTSGPMIERIYASS